MVIGPPRFVSCHFAHSWLIQSTISHVRNLDNTNRCNPSLYTCWGVYSRPWCHPQESRGGETKKSLGTHCKPTNLRATVRRRPTANCCHDLTLKPRISTSPRTTHPVVTHLWRALPRKSAGTTVAHTSVSSSRNILSSRWDGRRVYWVYTCHR